MVHRLLIGASLALVLGLVASVSPAPRAANAQIAPRDQSEPSLSHDSVRQQYVLVWAEDRGAGRHISAKRIWENALPIGGSVGGDWEATGPTGGAVAAGMKGDQRSPAVVDGLLVWSEKAPSGADYDIYAQRLFTNFRTYGNPMMVAGGPGDQSFPDVVKTPDGWLVVYSENTRDVGDVMGVRLTQALTPRGEAFPIAIGQGVAEDPTIGQDLQNPNYYLVMWTDDRAGNKDIYGTRVARTGLPRNGAVVSAFPIIQTPDNEYAPEYVVAKQDSATSGADDVRNLLMWTVDDPTDGANVLYQRQHANGYGIGRPMVLAGGPGIQTQPAAALRQSDASRDEWLAVWATDALGTLDVVGREVELNGIARPLVRPLSTD